MISYGQCGERAECMPFDASHRDDNDGKTHDQTESALKTKRCDALKTQRILLRIQPSATDIMAVIGINEKPFEDAASQLQSRVQQAPLADRELRSAHVRHPTDQ